MTTKSKKTAATPKAQAKAAGKASVPPLEGLDEKKLRALAAKIAKKKTVSEINDAISDAFDGPNGEAPWHLVRYGLLDPTRSPALVEVLGGEATYATDDQLLPVLACVSSLDPEGGEFPEWLDVLAAHALSRVETGLLAARPRLAPAARLCVDFVRGRSGRELSAAEKQAVLAAMGRVQGHHSGLEKRVAIIASDGKRSYQRLSAGELAAHFGDEAAWRAALLVGARRGTFSVLEQVKAGLLVADVEECIALIANREPSGDWDHDDVTTLVELLAERADPPAALFAAIAAVNPKNRHPVSTERLRLAAMARGAAAGVAVPAGFEDTLTFEEWRSVEAPFTKRTLAIGRLYSEGVRSLGRERALACAKRFLDGDEDTRYQFAGRFVGVFFDAALLERTLERGDDTCLGPWACAEAGLAALPRFEAGLAATKTDSARKNWTRLVQGALWGAARRGETIEPRWARLIDFGDEEKRWYDTDTTLMPGICAGLPLAERIRFLGDALTKAKHVERPFLAAVEVSDRAFRSKAVRTLIQRRKTISQDDLVKDALKRLGDDLMPLLREHIALSRGDRNFMSIATGAGADREVLERALGGKAETWLSEARRLARGGRERVYLVERPDDEVGLEARKNSWSALGGDPPGVPVPELRGKPMQHVLTLDLEEAPELAQRFPKARALSLFVPDARRGERYEDSKLVPVPEEAGAPKGGDPLTLVALDVPEAVFQASGGSEAAEKLRKLVFNRPGWLLGQPMWIQDDEGVPGQFVMQLAEGVGLNLGDSGILVVGTTGAVMQSM